MNMDKKIVREKLASWIDSSILADAIVEILAEYEGDQIDLQEAKEIYLKLLGAIPTEIRNIVRYTTGES